MSHLSRENPGCYHSMISYLSDVTGISRTKELKFTNESDLYYTIQKKWPKPKVKRKLKYKSYDIVVVDKDGNRFAFYDGRRRYSELGIVADHFLVTKLRSPEEFGVTIHKAGNYKDSLGSGWYSTVSLVRINNKYFAPEMECAH